MSILHLLDLSFTPSLKVFNRCLNLLHKDLLPHSGRWFWAPTSFRFQTLGIRVLKGPWLTIPQPRTHRARNATIMDRMAILLIHAQPTFTSSSNTRSYFSTITNPQWKLDPNPSSTELCSRKGETSGCGRSSERHNHVARYISRQFHSILTVSCILFFYSWESRDEIPVKGVVLSCPKILNFRMWLKFTKF
jgi:hypothetical protein